MTIDDFHSYWKLKAMVNIFEFIKLNHLRFPSRDFLSNFIIFPLETAFDVCFLLKIFIRSKLFITF